MVSNCMLIKPMMIIVVFVLFYSHSLVVFFSQINDFDHIDKHLKYHCKPKPLIIINAHIIKENNRLEKTIFLDIKNMVKKWGNIENSSTPVYIVTDYGI